VKRCRRNPEVQPCFAHGRRLARFPAAIQLSSRPLRVLLVVGVLVVTSRWTHSQTAAKPVAPPSATYASVKSFRIIQAKDGPAVEILSTKPLIPSIQALSQPERLVIDLPNARLDTRQKRISVQADMISTLRADQFQQNPPVVRVVVDLLVPRTYTWEAAGNRLLVHLGKNPPMEANKSPFRPPSVSSLTLAPKPVVAAVRPAGPVALIGSGMVSGSSITAETDTAILSLARGGEVHVCPGTTVSVTPAQNGHNLMFGVNTGAIEAHFTLDASSDSIITPDFRILLAGPGEFHYAISADRQGNTCVRALPGNTAPVTISELLGDRTFQVKPTDQFLFHSGQLDRVDMAVPLECGCPPARPPMQQADNSPPPVSETQPPASPNPVPSLAVSSEGPVRTANSAPNEQPAAAAPAGVSGSTNELHVQVEAPFVFRATGPPPAPVEDVRGLPLDSRSLDAPPVSAPLPPPPPQQVASQKASATPTHRGFFRRLGSFFAAIFR